MTELNKNSKSYTHIIWDWNGTLLDDLTLCLDTINCMLTARDLPPVSKEKYLDIFGFPVIDYYKKLGFNFNREPFEKISTEFITAYESGRPACQLMPGAKEILEILHTNGLTQSILSAAKRSYLIKAIEQYQIGDYFSEVNGLDNHHASGKRALAKEFVSKAEFDSGFVLLIGDTIHDSEIAEEIECDCWLIPNGHQNRQRLSKTGRPLLNSLTEVAELLQIE